MHDITVCYYYYLYLLLSRRIETVVRGDEYNVFYSPICSSENIEKSGVDNNGTNDGSYCNFLQFASEILHKYYSKNKSLIFLLV